MKRLLALLFFVSTFVFIPQTHADQVLNISPEVSPGYNRSLFKHWIDEDKDGCNTRSEVLIEEATVKPKIGKKCSLSGGKWVSPYDGKTHTKASSLDVDHLVPLAEAWRSGAKEWTAKMREEFANDLQNADALVAVTLSVNRSKGDRDVADWLPKINVCEYVYSWLSIKITYELTVDSDEAQVLKQKIDECSISGVSFSNDSESPKPYPSASTTVSPVPTPSPTISSEQSASPSPTSPTTNFPSPSASVTPSISSRIISPGAFCKSDEAGTLARSSNGTVYTCKVSATENRLRWRQ